MSRIAVNVRNMNCYCLCHNGLYSHGLNPQTGCCSCVSIKVPDAEAPNVIGYEFEINELKRRLSNLEDKYVEGYETSREIILSGNNNDERLRKLEEHKKYQIDENRKVSNLIDNVIDEMEDSIDHLNVDGIIERLKKVESFIYSEGDISAIHGQINNLNKNLEFVSNQVERLEKTISENELDMSCFPTFEYVNEYINKCLKEQINNRLIDCNSDKYYVSYKKPYKCPVCEGLGNTINPERTQCCACHTCEGKGIVWG